MHEWVFSTQKYWRGYLIFSEKIALTLYYKLDQLKVHTNTFWRWWCFEIGDWSKTKLLSGFRPPLFTDSLKTNVYQELYKHFYLDAITKTKDFVKVFITFLIFCYYATECLDRFVFNDVCKRMSPKWNLPIVTCIEYQPIFFLQ